MLLSDAYGGFGGISQYNRDFLDALCVLPQVGSVEALPRIAVPPIGDLPTRLVFNLDGLGGIARFTRAALKRGLTGPKPDIVICGHINLLPLCVLIATLRRAKLVMLIFGIEVWQPTARRLVDRWVSRIDTVISISRVTLERYMAWAAAPRLGTAILPNAIHLEHYGMAPKADDLVAQYGLADRKVLMTFGRMAGEERAKGFDEMIEILPRLRAKDPSFIYIAAGKGDDMARLKAKAVEFGVADHVVFTGMVPEDRKADYFRLADVYTMPSRGEGFGFVFLEAMACGVPAVASHSDGGFEAIRDGAIGIAIDPSSQDELENAIFTALSRGKQIPAGLAYFAFPNFGRRLGEMLFG
ncbi:glycosyltransferase family 4 protein [Sphingomonas sp. So64.6b]|uniref:glycosyltransferase family 4 protein n=1 Tax=Sphingomonas sp. So64.6b TaxID=2997354 RepID=UPI0016019DE3|nr:glycosyltransferase family 4 protein [Sphingomonas sp. So64.6b]QNA83250.1 glycosyltransferase family 4 protein [Sphingomonas sp. So64.6b]